MQVSITNKLGIEWDESISLIIVRNPTYLSDQTTVAATQVSMEATAIAHTHDNTESPTTSLPSPYTMTPGNKSNGKVLFLEVLLVQIFKYLRFFW